MNTRDFIFQGIRRWPVINLVTLVDGYSYLISLEIAVGYWKLRSFQETQANLNGVLEKHIYCETLKMESHEPSCGIFPKT